MMAKRVMFTRSEEERLRANNRKKEAERLDHARMVAQDKLMRASRASDTRVEKKRFARK
jgi:hypothetical protein